MSDAAEVIEVTGRSIVELGPDRIALLAPTVRLDEGEILSERGYPCWNPPCRRTVVTLTINGVDFVGRGGLTPLIFFFFVDPWRIFNLMEQELFLVILILCAISLINAVMTWSKRFEAYERYLSLKYRIKNRIIYPAMFRDRA